MSLLRLSLVKLVFLGSLLLTMAAQADIAAFNRAIQNGDYQSAARETTEIWAGFDRSSRQTAAVAREFGFVNYMARDFTAASMFAKFLVDSGAALAVPDDQPATSLLLLRLTEFSQDPVEPQRNALAEALTQRIEVPGVDSISLLAAETLYRNDWASGRWAHTRSSAEQAEQLNQRAGPAYLKEYREAGLHSAIAGFLESADHDDYEQLVTRHNQLVQDISSSEHVSIRPALLNLKWLAEAWVRTTEAYFHSSRSQIGTLIDSRLRYRDLLGLDPTLLTTSESAPENVCPGTVDVGTLRYPTRWAEQRLVGTVIMELAFDDSGRVSGSRILAEAPAGLFTEAINEAVAEFTWQVGAGLDQSSCVSSPKSLVHTIGFWGNCAATYVRGDCPRPVTHTDRRSLPEAANF